MNPGISNLKINDKTSLSEDIKVSAFKSNIRKTSAHKHKNYFEIIYLSAGSGQHTIDMQEFPIKPPVIFIIRKEQVHFWEIDTEPAGFVLIIKKSFLEKSLDKEIKLLFSKLSARSCLSPTDSGMIEQLFELLDHEYRKSSLENSAIIEGLLKALLAKMLQSSKADVRFKTRKENTYGIFIELLSRNNQLINEVAYYARLLHTTPQNLNAICRREANQPAARIISEFIISEAKRLLLYTNLTVTEISYALNFKDNSHFTKYFKKHAGITPNSFRNAKI
jgi:AraC family transcriptional regulator, transcriptional activator of pobA